MESTSSDAAKTGYIRTLGERQCNFPSWEINEYRRGKLSTTGTRVEIEELYIKKYKKDFPDATKEKIELIKKELKKEDQKYIKRAFTYKALNKLIQGSAADMTKTAMLNLYKEGIIAHIQIHDELDISIESDEKAKKIIEIMENAVTLLVPNKVDYKSGETWGDIYN
mgnify:FL=1